MAESLHCLPETITTLLIDYTPRQNKTFKKINSSQLQSIWNSMETQW